MCSEVAVFTCGSLWPSACSVQKVQGLLSSLQLPTAILQHNKSSGCLVPCQINPFKQQLPLSQPAPLHSMGHPQISSLFPADHLWFKSLTAAWGMPTVLLSAQDTKVPGTMNAHAIGHFQWRLPSEMHRICCLPTEHLGFSGWKHQCSSTRSCFLTVLLITSIRKLARVTPLLLEAREVIPHTS